MKKAIGTKIKIVRELKNKTRKQMAAEMGLSLSGYGKIELGEIDLTLSRLEEITLILEVNVLQIILFDSSHTFNIQGNGAVVGAGMRAGNVFFVGKENDLYKDKCIKALEEENELLRRELVK